MAHSFPETTIFSSLCIFSAASRLTLKAKISLYFCALKEQWFAESYIAIDQGPIVVMMENYRSGLVWDSFMKNADIRQGLSKLGFNY